MANANGPVERKVVFAGITSAVVTLVMAYVIKHWPALTPYSAELQSLLAAAVAGAATFLVAWWAKHTARNDKGTQSTGTSDPIPPTS